jgi:hypothetical protein
MSISIYLAGKIQKSHEPSDEAYWSERDLGQLQASLLEYRITFLNPALRTDDLSDQHSVFGRDMLQVFLSDLVFVDARDRRGLGVGAEMMWAKFHRRPVLTLAPMDTCYVRSQANILGVEVKDFVHPFVKGLSDQIVGSVAEGGSWIRQLLQNKTQPIRGLEHIQDAMHYYREAQLESDHPMCELVKLDHLSERLNQMIQQPSSLSS